MRRRAWRFRFGRMMRMLWLRRTRRLGLRRLRMMRRRAWRLRFGRMMRMLWLRRTRRLGLRRLRMMRRRAWRLRLWWARFRLRSLRRARLVTTVIAVASAVSIAISAWIEVNFCAAIRLGPGVNLKARQVRSVILWRSIVLRSIVAAWIAIGFSYIRKTCNAKLS